MRYSRLSDLIIVFLFFFLIASRSYALQNLFHSLFYSDDFGVSFRSSIQQNRNLFRSVTLMSLSFIIPVLASGATIVAATDPEFDARSDLMRLKKGLGEIDYLLNHWDEKTTYCNFGEFQRELMDEKNKEKLLKAAAETGLLDYDKSKTMNIVCKRDPEMVRALLGLTSENKVLQKADVLMKKPDTLELIDSDDFDKYMEAVDKFTEAVAAVDGLAYNARTDFASTETFKKDDSDDNKSKYLEQSKSNVAIARDSLKSIVSILKL